MADVLSIAGQFDFPGEVGEVIPYGSGLINDTYVVSFKTHGKSLHPRLGKRAILQRINSEVFPDPAAIMHNLAVVLEHARHKSNQSETEFLLPPIYKTQDDQFCFQDESDHYWRTIGFIEHTETSDTLKNLQQAREAGAALGAFHQLMEDLPVNQLQDTLPGFHDTPNYLQQFDIAFRETVNKAGSEDCVEQINAHRQLARLLVDSQPQVSVAVMHGDPKLNNILFDQQSGKAVSIIDLDTVKPGFIHYDIGDCIRSCCNRAGEMPATIEETVFDVNVFESLLEGYFSLARQLMNDSDFDVLYDVVRLLPFELGLRFFTDYLQGNRYFKVTSADDNLFRARVQFQLLASIEQQEQSIRQIIAQCIRHSPE